MPISPTPNELELIEEALLKRTTDEVIEEINRDPARLAQVRAKGAELAQKHRNALIDQKKV